MQVIDFMTPKSTKGRLELETIARAAMHPDKNPRLLKGVISRPG